MATLTIKIDSEELARKVLSHLGYLSDEEIPDLISVAEPEENEVIDEEPVLKKELTNEEVFAFLRSKGMTLESACKQDPDFGEFIASFTTSPEKRIHGDIEPAGGKSLGTDIADLDVETVVEEATGTLLDRAKDDLRKEMSKLGNDKARYDYLSHKKKYDPSLVIREAARLLLVDMPSPDPTPLENISYDSDSDGDADIQKMALERAKEEREALDTEKDKIRKQAMSIESEYDRFNYILSNYSNSIRIIRNATQELAFEFLANRNLDPTWIKQLAEHTPHLVEKLYQYKESQFIVLFKKENGI